MKLRGALLLVVAATICALSGLISPQEVMASVDAVNQWPAKPTIASNSNTATVSGNFTVGAGSNRLMLIAVVAKTSAAPTAMTVSYNGYNLTMAQALTSNTTQLNKIWLFALNDTQMGAAGVSRPLSVSFTGAGTITAAYVSAAVYGGVNQTTPTTGANAASKAAAGTTLALSIPLTGNLGLAGNTGLTVYVASWDGQTTSTPHTGYTEIRDYQGLASTFSLAYCAKVTTGTTTEAPTTTGAAAVVAAAAGVSLNPVAKPATIAACGDCHGNPPQDGPYVSARNNPPGQFLGAHSKHVGTDEGQYGNSIVCSACHYPAANTKHSTGFKNISGTKVPRNTYGGVTNIAATNSPAYTQTCTKSTCHSTGRANIQYVASPVWTGTTTCLSCHGGRNSGTGAYSRNASNFTMSTTHSQHLGKYPSANINCNNCHGKIAASHTALKDYTGAIYHGNGTKNVIFNDIAYASYSSYKTSGVDAGKCTNTACHGGKTRSAWSNTGAVNSYNTCVHCHGVDTTSAALPNTAANRRFFAPGYKVAATVGTSTDQINSSNNIRVGSHFKHLSSVYMKSLKCNECHRVPQTVFDGSHAASTRFNSQTLTFAQASTATITIGVASGTPARLAAFGGYTNGTAVKAATCSSVYCHGSRLKTADTSGSVRTPYWNYSAMINYTNPNQACGRCHGNPPTTGSAASTHSGYVGQPTTSCSTCHGTVVNSSGQIINKNLHINGVVNANGSGHEYGFGGSKHRPGGTGTIQANSAAPFSNCGCHMVNAAALVGYSAVRHKGLSQGTCTKCHSTNTANFLGASPGCGDCHGTNANGGQPNGVATASAFPNWSGSHTAHVVQQSMTCADCHSGAGTGTPTHGNYSGILKTRANVSVAFNTAKSGPAVWSAGAMTCSSSFCHGQKSPAWGQNVASLKCQYCHGSQTLAYAGYTQATIAPGTNNIDTNRVTGVTPRGGMHTQHLEGTTGFSRRVRCQDCHVTVTPATLATHLNMTTATITFPANPDSVSRGTWNDSPGVTRPTATGLINCGNTACHTGKTNTGTAPTPVWNDTTYLTATAPSATLTVADCTKCHALPPTPGSGAHASVATVGSFPLNSACGSNCHGMTTSATTFGTIFPNKDLHINGKIEGGSDCLGCHNSPQGIRPAIGGEFAQKSHHVQGRAVTNNDCFMCHMEAADATGTPSSFHTGAPGGPVDLIVFTGAAGTGTRGTYTYVTYTANGKRHQIRKLNDHCLGCHNVTNNSTAVYVAGSTPGKYSPEQYLKTPVAKTPILSRYSSTRLVAWSQYKYSTATGGVNRFGTNNKAQITKALSAHGNAVKNQFPQFDKVRGDDSWLNVDSSNGALGANRNVLCYDCHNSHGSPVAGITTSYSSATGRNKGGLLKTTVAGERGYSVTYTPASRTIAYKNYSRTSTTTTSALFNSGASICNDCHNNDTSKVNISRPWSITATYSSLKPIVGYWSTPYFDNYTMMSALRTTYKQGGAVNGLKDLRKPMGGHYGSSVNGTQAGHDKEVNGLCTPCHDPHGVSNALGADRDHGVPLLKGTWVTSPYREDRADTIVKRGGGSNWTGMNSMGAVPGYHIDQNTFLTAGTATGLKNAGAATATSKSNLRSQRFRSFSNLSSAKTATGYPNLTVATFGGLCMECHNQTTLTGSASAPAAASAWMTQQRVHQSVAGWAATASGTDNLNNRRHAYTCSKCHTPHVSRLPRLLVTNCLDARHAGKVATGGLKDGMISTATATTNTFGNINQSLASSARGGGRFPGGGSRYSGTPGSAQNSGGWWFQTNGAAGTTQPGTLNATVNYGGTQCHNSATAGGATWSPANQMWNKKSRW